MSLARAHIIVSGFVQGVGYRFFVEDQAPVLNLAGYVRNLPSGGVEVEVEGEKENIEKMIELLKNGPGSAQVTRAAVTWKEYRGDFHDFRIRF